MGDDQLFWGEIHTHTALSDGNGSPEDNFAIARSHLDFWAMADHAYDAEVFNTDYREVGADRRLLNDCWDEVQDLCRAHEAPGTFIPFLAYEWTNYQYGHHNIYYLDYDQPIRMPPTLPELYDSLSGVEALVIPHHGGYPQGVCGKNWDYHDDRMSPFVEIYSLHGSSEEPDGIRPLLTRGSWMGPGGGGGSVQEGLARGYTLGIMASSDSHGQHPGAYDNGLIAAYSADLSRPALWSAFRQRRIYGVTGDRISLDFRINGQPMGSVLEPAAARAIEVSAVAWDKVDRVDILRNNSVFHSFVEPRGKENDRGDRLRFRFMVEWGWDVRHEHEWMGRLQIRDGRILQAIPCYRGPAANRLGRGIRNRDSSACTWTSRTLKPPAWGFSRLAGEGIAFELEGARDAPLEFTFTCDGRERRIATTPGEVLNGSAVTYVDDIPPTNNGAHWRQLQHYGKIKIHQGWEAGRLSLQLRCQDTADAARAGGRDFYYARVIQRNGQRAWSSPIWVER
jgi:hypothetical protein